MIHYLKRNQLNVAKYDACIESAQNSRIYAFSWYLDIVADNWDVLVLNDYEAVMPLPWRQKYFIKYVYTPFWVLQLGIFSINENNNVDSFLKEVLDKFRFVNLRLNSGNKLFESSYNSNMNQMQFLYLDCAYELIVSKYSRNRIRDCKKAIDNELIEKWGDFPSTLIKLFKNNVGKRVSKIQEKDYENLLKLMHCCLANNSGEMLSIYTKSNKLIAIAFFLKHKNIVTQLVCTADFNNRDNGANTFMNDRAINRYQEYFDIYNFGGSSMKNISKYYKSFGAESEYYHYLEINKLPVIISLFKS